MCGRVAQEYTFAEIAETIDILRTPASNLQPRYNIGPRQKLQMIRPVNDELVIRPALFELVPHWHRGPLKEKKYSTFNATSEKLVSGETKSFVPAWKSGKRGVVPVSGFYEWPRPKQAGSAPMYIQSADKPILLLGCLWSIWTDPDTGEDLDTTAIITVPANDFMKAIPHHRCPLVIDPERLTDWLTCPVDEAESYCASPPSEVFEGAWVSSYVNKIGNEGPDCIVGAA